MLIPNNLYSQEEEIIILFKLFDAHPGINDDFLKERIPNRLSEYMDEDLTIVEGDIVKLLEYSSISESYDVLYDSLTRIYPKFKYAHYQIEGKLFPNEITVSIIDLDNGTKKNTSVKWNEKKPFAPTPLRKLTNQIKEKLNIKVIKQAAGFLHLDNHSTSERWILLNKDSVFLGLGKTNIPIQKTGTVKISLLEENEERFSKLYIRQLNRYKITQGRGGALIKNKIQRFNLSGGLLFNESKPTFYSMGTYTIQTLQGITLGLSGLLTSKAFYDYTYPTLDNIPIQQATDFSYFNSGGVLLGYQMYIPPLEGEIAINARYFLYPDQGLWLDADFTPRYLEWLKVSIGYHILNLPIDDVQFNEFGNATISNTTKKWSGFHIAIGYQYIF